MGVPTWGEEEGRAPRADPKAQKIVATLPIFKDLDWNKVFIEDLFYEGPGSMEYYVQLKALASVVIGGMRFPKGTHISGVDLLYSMSDFKRITVNGIPVCDHLRLHGYYLAVVEMKLCSDSTINGLKIPGQSQVVFYNGKLDKKQDWFNIYCVQLGGSMKFKGENFAKGETLRPYSPTGRSIERPKDDDPCYIEAWGEPDQPVPIDDSAKKAIAKFPIFKEMDWNKADFRVAVFEGPEKSDYYVEFLRLGRFRLGGREISGALIKGNGLSYRAFSIDEMKIGQWKICERFGQNAQTLQVFEAEFCQEIPLPEGKIPARSVLSFVNGLPEGNLALKDIACIIPSQALTLNGTNINAGQAAEIKDGQVSFPKKPCIPLRDQIYYKKRDPWDPK
ncbi:MAG: hypothetical protein IT288_14205 [Bdellovibrionales bacterium]|nr:hypothetical protein [Bdellovibrionales bacterium]